MTTTLTNESIGAAIRSISSSRGFTGADLAQATNLTPIRIQLIEDGRDACSAIELVKIAAALDMTPGDILATAEGESDPETMANRVIDGLAAPTRSLLEARRRVEELRQRVDSDDIRRLLSAALEINTGAFWNADRLRTTLSDRVYEKAANQDTASRAASLRAANAVIEYLRLHAVNDIRDVILDEMLPDTPATDQEAQDAEDIARATVSEMIA